MSAKRQLAGPLDRDAVGDRQRALDVRRAAVAQRLAVDGHRVDLHADDLAPRAGPT